MNRRQKIIVSITGIFIIMLALVGLTYAYFLTRITGNEEVDNKNLAYNIIENAKNNKNGTRLVNTPPSKVAEESTLVNWNLGKEENIYYQYYAGYEIAGYAESEEAIYRCTIPTVDEITGEPITDCSGVKSYTSCTDDVKGKYAFVNWASPETIYVEDCDNGEIVINKVKYEKVLSSTQDDYGTSYYYRGKVDDNYVNFAGMCWRIVRIQGDGSVKLILEDRYAECNDKETDITSAVYTGNWSDGNYYDPRSEVLDFLEGNFINSFKSFQTNKLSSNNLEKLKVDNWCFDNTILSIGDGEYGEIIYAAGKRIYTDKKPSLVCTGTKITKYDDNTDMYVGTLTADEMSYAGAYSSQGSIYLINKYITENEINYYSFTPNNYSEYTLNFWHMMLYYGGLGVSDFSGTSRPAVTLKTGTIISDGDGTIDNPYVIN